MILLAIWLINTLTLLVVAYVLPGFTVASFYAALIASILLGFMNAVVRPILLVLTLPVTILTLGLFTFVINALMLSFVSTIVKGFDIDQFSTALLAAIWLWVVSFLTNVVADRFNR